jgi:hypothetical protein
MSYINDYMRHIEERALPELRKQLKSLASGERMSKPSQATGWMDTTGRQIALLTRAITDYEDLLTKHFAKFSTRRAQLCDRAALLCPRPSPSGRISGVPPRSLRN